MESPPAGRHSNRFHRSLRFHPGAEESPGEPVHQPDEYFTKIPGGLPGVETRGELMWSCGVARRKISVAQMCRLLSENPARLYGLFPRKGILQPGSDADIVVYDPSGGHVIRAEDCVSAAGYSPYEGFASDGGIRQVWLRGKLAVESGSVLDSVPCGKYMARGKCSL